MCVSAVQAATLQGIVQDTAHQPAVGASVHLLSQTMKTDASGAFRFDKLPAGSYTLSAEGTRFGPFVVAADEVKKVELTLQAPAFFDEPKFVVAGVTAGTYQGGHGSDVILRSTEGLATAAASLGDAGAGSASEKAGDALAAVHEFQRAAEQEPSERNLFALGAELLQHRADRAAIEVFTKGQRLFPGSSRMTIGLAVAYYAQGSYEAAAHWFFAACDLDRQAPGPYLFLAKVESPAITKSSGFRERLARFAKLQPENAQADYHYAAALWSQRSGPEDADTPAKVKALLEKAVHIDPKLGPAYTLLGMVEFDGGHLQQAAAALEKAIASDPNTEEAHYRLAQVYRRMGELTKARDESAVYEELSRKSADEAQSKRRELQQFVIELKTQ
jgi:tetratricopeptide (TPR) repeat protein